MRAAALFGGGPDMNIIGRSVANLFLHHQSAILKLRNQPIIGNILSMVSRRLLPRDALVCAQIQGSPLDGLWIYLNPRTAQNIQHTASELAALQAVVDYLRPGMTFFDVGANMGGFSLLAARIVGPSGAVISFEPDPDIAERLTKNLARNGFHHATIVQKAVWSEPGELLFVRVDAAVSPDRGLGHVATSSSDSANAISVAAVSLDSFCALGTKPDFIKCDVEGAEAAVFEGASELLRQVRPILLIEMHSEENHRLLTEKLSQRQYSCRDLDANHVLALPQ